MDSERFTERVSAFEASRLKPTTIRHHLDVQGLRLRALAAGWREWLGRRVLDVAELGLKRAPDALVTSPRGRCCAVEVERLVKAPKQYVTILRGYLRSIEAGHLHAVHWVTPHPGPLKALLDSIEGLPDHTGMVRRLTAEQRARFPVFAVKEWPPA